MSADIAGVVHRPESMVAPEDGDTLSSAERKAAAEADVAQAQPTDPV
jgi:hypothetical protein